MIWDAALSRRGVGGGGGDCPKTRVETKKSHHFKLSPSPPTQPVKQLTQNSYTPPPQQKVLQQICAYSEEADVNVILKYYLKKVVEKQPDNVIDFLLEEIATNPYTPPPKEESK